MGDVLERKIGVPGITNQIKHLINNSLELRSCLNKPHNGYVDVHVETIQVDVILT